MATGRSVLERFWDKVNKVGPVVEGMATPCWIWTGAGTRNGYGRVVVGWDPVGRRYIYEYAHRLSWMMAHGMPPTDKTVDHRCFSRRCVNTSHFEIVSRATNALRGHSVPAANAIKTHCKNGHAFVEGNISWARGHRSRSCITCGTARHRAAARAKSAATEPSRLARKAALAARNDTLVREALSGAGTIGQIAIRHGVHRITVDRALRAVGAFVRGPNPR